MVLKAPDPKKDKKPVVPPPKKKPDAKDTGAKKPPAPVKKDDPKMPEPKKDEKRKSIVKRKSIKKKPVLKPKPKRKLLFGEEAKREYSQRLITAMQPIRIFALMFGQFPMTYKEDKQGIFVFKFSWYNFCSWHFLIMMTISILSLLMGTWNLYAHVVDVHEGRKVDADEIEERWLEKSLLHRHMMWVISCFAAVAQTTFSTFYMFQNRYYMPNVFTFYSRVVQELHMDISDGAFALPLVILLIYCCTTVAILIMGILRFAPVTVGTPTLFGVYLFRLFLTSSGVWIDDVDTETRKSIQVMGALFLFIIFTASKVQMFMFIYHCKLLKNAFACWNGRAYIALMKGGRYFHTEEGKVTYRLLYKDHCVLLDILEAANRLCSGSVETYYGLQTATIFFEIYFFLRAARYGDDYNLGATKGGLFFIRPFDWVPGGLLALQSIIIAMVTAKTAANVGQEAMAGYDIVRRKTMLFRKTDDELLFQLSLQASYNAFSKFDFSAGGYQYFNMDWIMGYVNNIAGYFIILYQFQPVMDRSTTDWGKRVTLGEFLEILEGLPKGHFTSTEAPPAVTYP